MCRRCGCISRSNSATVRPVIIEGILEPALLSLLLEGQGYGYELAAQLERRALVPQRATPSRVYETLRILESDGAVVSSPETNPSGPDRRRYGLTEAGRTRLDRWMKALHLTDHSLHELLKQYRIQRKETNTMGCSCCGGNGQQVEEPIRAEGNTEVLEARVAQLEAELRATQLEAELKAAKSQSE